MSLKGGRHEKIKIFFLYLICTLDGVENTEKKLDFYSCSFHCKKGFLSCSRTIAHICFLFWARLIDDITSRTHVRIILRSCMVTAELCHFLRILSIYNYYNSKTELGWFLVV